MTSSFDTGFAPCRILQNKFHKKGMTFLFGLIKFTPIDSIITRVETDSECCTSRATAIDSSPTTLSTSSTATDKVSVSPTIGSTPAFPSDISPIADSVAAFVGVTDLSVSVPSSPIKYPLNSLRRIARACEMRLQTTGRGNLLLLGNFLIRQFPIKMQDKCLAQPCW